MADKEILQNVCEFEEDSLLPSQESRLKEAVAQMVQSCKD